MSVGLLATITHVITATTLVAIDFSVMSANIIAFFVALIFSYSLQASVTFRAQCNLRNFTRFILVSFSILMWISLSSYVSNKYEMNSYATNVFIGIFIPVWSYVLHTTFTFKPIAENND